MTSERFWQVSMVFYISAIFFVEEAQTLLQIIRHQINLKSAGNYTECH